MINIWKEEIDPPLWDRPYTRSMRLSADPVVVAALIKEFGSDPQTSGRFANLRFEPPPEYIDRVLLSATWTTTSTPVLVKLNVDPWELHWMLALGECAPDLVPQVIAGGERVGPHMVRWLVLEQIPYPLSHSWGDRMYDLLAAAAVRFQHVAQMIERRSVGLVCMHSTASSIERALRAGCPAPAEQLLDRIESDWAWVNEQCGLEVCFGDLTMGNSLSRSPHPSGEAILLIDPIPRIAPWAWDGAYCQTIDANSDVRLIQRMAKVRQAIGLPGPEPPALDRMAAILLAWLGAHRWWSVPFRQEDPEWRLQIQRYMEVAASF